VIAISVALIFLFPLYWGRLDQPAATARHLHRIGAGHTLINFQPTLDNWVSQLSNPETRQAFANSAVVANLRHASGARPRRAGGLRSARFQFSVRMLTNKDITVWFLSQRVLRRSRRSSPLSGSCAARPARHLAGPDPDQRHLHSASSSFVILRQTFLDLPVELEEAALVDGATHFGAFSRVALPLAAPAMAARR